MRFATLIAVALSPLSAFAYIYSIAPASNSFRADATTSTFPVIFTTASTKVEFYDLVVSFGLTTPAERAGVNNTLGNPLFNLDLLAFKRFSTGPGQFTVDVPITVEDLYNGPGTYVLTAAILRATGDQNAYLFRADPFTITFNATTV